MPPTAFLEEAESRLTLDAAGAVIGDAAALQVPKGAFSDGDARFLMKYHGVELEGVCRRITGQAEFSSE